MLVCSFEGLGKETRLFSDSKYCDSVGKRCQSAGSSWPQTEQGSECDSNTCLSPLHLSVTTCERAGSSCRLVSSLQWSETASVHVMLVIPGEKSETQLERKTLSSARGWKAGTGWKYTDGMLWFDTVNTTTAQAGCELWLKRKSGCGLVNPAHLKSTIKID